MRRRTPQSALGDLLRAQCSANVRELRKRRGLTQSQLAAASGLGRAFINQVERGHCSVTLETIGAVATALGVRPAALVSKDPEPNVESVLTPERDAASDRMRAGRRG